MMVLGSTPPTDFLTTLSLGVGGIAFQLLAAVVLSVWGWRVSKRQGSGWWSLFVWMPLFALGIEILGILWTLVQLMDVFAAVANISPDDKATVLKNGISEAMVTTWVSLAVAGVLLLVSLMMLVVATVKKPSQARG
jgi:hypothetical protein